MERRANGSYISAYAWLQTVFIIFISHPFSSAQYAPTTIILPSFAYHINTHFSLLLVLPLHQRFYYHFHITQFPLLPVLSQPIQFSRHFHITHFPLTRIYFERLARVKAGLTHRLGWVGEKKKLWKKTRHEFDKLWRGLMDLL